MAENGQNLNEPAVPEETTPAGGARTGKALTPAARRALAEAEERRSRHQRSGSTGPKEIGGRDGPEPTRYGDWEKDGILSDF